MLGKMCVYFFVLNDLMIFVKKLRQSLLRIFGVSIKNDFCTHGIKTN